MTSNKIQAAHDAIDRLVTELERQATEHVHALDALRAEVESLRTQNEHLRHLVDESRKVHEANAREVDAKPVREVVRGTYFGWPAIAEAGKDPEKGGGRIAVDYGKGKDRDWSIYLNEEYPTGNGACQYLTEQQAIAWVLDGVLPTR